MPANDANGRDGDPSNLLEVAHQFPVRHSLVEGGLLVAGGEGVVLDDAIAKDH